jgi:hypothetical protein
MGSDFIKTEAELRRSVLNFMAKPNLWRKACGNNPKYFVYLRHGVKPQFGLSKFCAFKDISLSVYVDGKRKTTDGTTTRKHIERTMRRPWIPLWKVSAEVQGKFHSWFAGFFPNMEQHEKNISLLTLDSD